MIHTLRKILHRIDREYTDTFTRGWMVDLSEDQEEDESSGFQIDQAPSGFYTPRREASSNPLDSDLRVPEYKGNFNNGTPDGGKPVRFASTRYKTIGGKTRTKIFYNTHAIDQLWGAGVEDWERIIAHERDHANGWGHYQGNPRINKAYYPSVKITGR